MTEFRSKLKQAKNLGSSGNGSHHWLQQRFTAIILVIGTIWMFCFSSEIFAEDSGEYIEIIKKPYHAISLILFALTMFYHSSLGMRVVIEDYIHIRLLKLFLIFGVQIFSLITAVAFSIAVIYVMTL